MFSKNLILKKFATKSNKSFIFAQQSLNNAKNTLKKAEVLQRTKKNDYQKTYLQLQKLFGDMERSFESIQQLYFQINELAVQYKYLKTMKFKESFNFQNYKFNELFAHFSKIADEFQIPWTIIDEDFSNILDVSQHLLKFIETKKYTIPFYFNKYRENILDFRKELNLVEQAKINAEFNQANLQLDNLKNQIKNLITDVNSLEKIEYSMHHNLPDVLYKKANSSQLSQAARNYYHNLYADLEKMISNSDQLTNEQIITRIRSIYQMIYSMHYDSAKKVLLKKFYTQNSALIQQVLTDYKLQINNLKKPSNKLVETYANLNKIAATLQNIENFETALNNLKYFLTLAKTFDREYFYIIQKNQLKSTHTCAWVEEIFDSINFYFLITTSEFLDSSETTNKKIDELIKIYNKHFAKINNTTEIENIWNDWTQKLTELTQIIAQNEEYLKMYKVLEAHISNASKFRSKTNETKEVLKQAKIELLNKKYQEAYAILKNFARKN
ncbi:hypothetical protein [Mycoplasma buteonis]|uniref:hypothetical protein n=1 Tax=Mycoplasma buteonis TaxID=171280 RepID=UPI000AA4DDBF|nr:hypothetical protein [Mycoplasma buteonis]